MKNLANFRSAKFLAIALGTMPVLMHAAPAQALMAPAGTTQLHDADGDDVPSNEGKGITQNVGKEAVALNYYANGVTTSTLSICPSAAPNDCQVVATYTSPTADKDKGDLQNPYRVDNIAWSAGNGRVQFTLNQATNDPRVVVYDVNAKSFPLGQKGISARDFAIIPPNSGRLSGDLQITGVDGRLSAIDPSKGTVFVSPLPAEQYVAASAKLGQKTIVKTVVAFNNGQ